MFAGSENGETRVQLAGRLLDDGSHLGGRIRGMTHRERGDGISELAAEPSGGCDRADQHDERGGGALLAGVTVGGLHDVGTARSKSAEGCDDDGVLAAGFGEEPEVGAEGVEQLGGFVGAGEDHLVDRRMGDELRAERALVDVDQGEEFGGGAGGGECPVDDVGEHGAASLGWSGRLEGDRGTGGECGESGSGGNGDRKVPGRRHEGEGGRG